VNFKTISKASGYSTATVSLALSGHPRISESTRQKIKKIAKTLGYTPSPAVRALMSEIRRPPMMRSRMDVAFINNWSHPFLTGPEEPLRAFFEGAVRSARQLGYLWNEHASGGNRDKMALLEKTLKHRNVDGALIFPTNELGYLPLFKNLNIPMIAVGLALPDLHVTTVQADHYLNVCTAFKMLFQRGCRRIGFVSDKYTSQSNYFRFSGAYLASLHESGIEPIEPLIVEGGVMREISAYVERMKCDGILVGPNCNLTDIRASGGDYARKVRIATYCGMCRNDLRNRISGIDERWEYIGGIAMDHLAKNIELHTTEKEEGAKLILIPGVWVEGETTMPLKTSARRHRP